MGAVWGPERCILQETLRACCRSLVRLQLAAFTQCSMASMALGLALDACHLVLTGLGGNNPMTGYHIASRSLETGGVTGRAWKLVGCIDPIK